MTATNARKSFTLKEFGLLLGMVLVIAIGAGVYYTDGVSSRVPAEVRAFNLTGMETSQYWRRGECLLLPEQGKDGFKTNCMASGEHPRILVWGDSYAAAISQGFVQLAKAHHFSIGWLSSSSCPPFMGFVMELRPFCKENNDWIMENIRKNPPDIVIMHSTWSYDPGDIERGLARTVSELREIGIKKIVLLGPVSTWKGDGLSTIFTDYYMRSGYKLMPKYSFYKSNLQWAQKYEKILKEQAAKLDITYVSALDVMCKPEGCLTRVGDHDEMLTAFDAGHMTVPGATYVVGQLLPQILK